MKKKDNVTFAWIERQLDRRFAEEAMKNVECCQAWSKAFVTRRKLINGEMNRRLDVRKKMDNLAAFFACMAAFASFVYAGQNAIGNFMDKLVVAIVVFGSMFVGVFLFLYICNEIFAPSTRQDVIEKHLFGDEDG